MIPRLLFSLILICLLYPLEAQVVNIPDPNFKTALLRHTPPVDLDKDGEIQVSEAAAFKGKLFIQSKNITDMTGIEAFTSMDTLFAGFNEIDTLDLTKNTQLSVLNLNTSGNLKEVSVTGLKNLTSIDLAQSGNLKRLDVTTNTGLEILKIAFSPFSDSLDLSNNPNLKHLTLYGLSNLHFIQWSDTAPYLKLQEIIISQSQMKSIPFHQFPNLTYLVSRDAQLSEMDLSKCPKINQLFCSGMPELTLVNLLNGDLNNLMDLNFTNCPKLQHICVKDSIKARNNKNWKVDDPEVYSESFCKGTRTTQPYSSWDVFPNPVQTHLYMGDIPQSALLQLRCYNQMGQRIYPKQDAHTLDFSPFENGLYLLQIPVKTGELVTWKIVKR